MTLLHRSTHKDSKTSSFSILRFFYNLLWFSKVSAIKEKQTCTEDPELSSNANSSEQVPIGTIHMSLGFIVRSLPFIKFLREVPNASWSRGWARERWFPAGKGGLRQRRVVGEHGGYPPWPRVAPARLGTGLGGLATCVHGAQRHSSHGGHP